MWHDSVKDTRQQKERWGWGLAARGGGVGSWTKSKKGGRQYSRALHKMGVLGLLCQL